MSTADNSSAYDDSDTATIADTNVVAYEAVIARLASEHPNASVAEIDEIVRSEHEAISGGRPIVLPLTVIAGVEERLDEQNENEAP